jgi:hypothetical protein
VKADTDVERGLVYGIAKVDYWQTPRLRLNRRRRACSNHNDDVEAEHTGNGCRNFRAGSQRELKEMV